MRTLSCALGILVTATTCGCARQPASDPEAARAALDEYVLNFWVRRDTTALGRALAPNMVYHYNGKVIAGDPPSHLRALRNFGEGFPDLAATVDVFTVSGSIGAAVTSWSGTHTGVLCQTPGSGKKANWVVNYVFRVQAGRIVELWEAWDEGGTYRPLGVDPAKCE